MELSYKATIDIESVFHSSEDYDFLISPTSFEQTKA